MFMKYRSEPNGTGSIQLVTVDLSPDQARDKIKI